MPYPLDSDSIITLWLTNSELWNNHEQVELTIKNHLLQQPRQQPSSLISNLSSLFIITVSYYNLTKQEALDAIGYFLYEYDDLIHSQLLDCFINHHFLYKVPSTPYFTINYHQSTSGIFIPLTKCYSPSCQLNDITCYSPLCPNRRISSLLHLVNHHQQTDNCNNKEEQEQQQNQNTHTKDWITSIPHHIRNSTNRKELKRQAGIAELLLTEQNYCQDLDILHRIYAIPLLESSQVISNPSRRQRFYNNVFGNYLDITHLHHSFYNQLTSHNRQSSFFIGRVGTIIMQHVTNLIEPYIQYASNHVKAIYCMTIEHKNNPQFAKFLSEQNALKCTRRLGLRHYLTSPTLWIGKLKLMVQAILKNTVDDADQLSLKASLAILHDTLCRMNSCASLSSEDFRFEELSTSIYTVTGTELQLLAIPDGSVLIREEALWLARSTRPLQPSLCHVFLFSHALILTHPRVTNGRTEYIVISGSPIPIQLLSIDNRNATTSMIRRLSFASTSMVSTPIHLINNIRRQKSMNSVISSHSSNSNTSNSTNSSNSGKLCRSNTIIHTTVSAPPNAKLAQGSCTSISAAAAVDRKNRILIPFQIKTKLSKLKSNFRWSTSFSVPVSPTVNTEVVVSRRDSAPALLTTYNHDDTTKATQQQQQRRRTLKISHMAYPENAFKLEFLSRSDRLIWENVMKDVIMNCDKSNHFFKIKMICKSLMMPSSSSSSTAATTTTMMANGTNFGAIGRIQCAYALAYSTHRGKSSMVALGTQSGVWMGPRDGSSPFQLVLPNQDVYQIFVLQDKLVVLSHDHNKHRLLIAYSLKSILDHQDPLDWCVVKRSSVICFTVGKVRNQSVIIYLTKRLQTTWLVIIVPNNINEFASNNSYSKNHWFKKYRMEYKVTIKDPTDIQIICDSVFIRSDRNGIERIDINADSSIASSSSANSNNNNSIFKGSNVGLLSFTNGFVCDSQYAYSVSLFDQVNNSGRGLIRIKFESQVNSIAVVYPHLVAFSSSVIEIRNIETTELVQVIRGNQIQFISITNDHTQPLFFTMVNDDRTTTSIYQLQLSL